MKITNITTLLRNNQTISIKFRCLILLLIFSPFIQAQHHVTENVSINSIHLKELRQVRISIPKKYDSNSKEKLDVLYVLDGEWATSLTQTVYEFLAYAEFIPTNLIIVSIPNSYKDGVNMRRRDFIPSSTQSTSTGVANFLAFLKDELMPLIDKKYPTNTENNILYGSSLGGLFAVYTYLEDPTLFKSYISIEPVLRLNENHINKIASERFEMNKDSKNTLWIASRDGKAFDEMGIGKFKSLLKQKAPKNLHWKVATYANETHFSVIWKGIYDGMKFTYTKSKPIKN